MPAKSWRGSLEGQSLENDYATWSNDKIRVTKLRITSGWLWMSLFDKSGTLLEANWGAGGLVFSRRTYIDILGSRTPNGKMFRKTI
jgi:hypothetical protein